MIIIVSNSALRCFCSMSVRDAHRRLQSCLLPTGSGNEPDIFAPWMFNWAGRPDLTQNLTRQLLKKRYVPTPNIGLPGNDDYGTMSVERGGAVAIEI